MTRMLATLVRPYTATILRTNVMNRYKRKAVLEELVTKAKTVSANVFPSTRPTATTKMDDFIVVRLPQGIDPYADTHNIAYVQMNCFVRDRQGGIENSDVMEEMIEGVSALFPFNDALMSCNDTPLVLETKSDGMGFHSTIIQFKVVIKL